jgi:DNA-binding Lrp family transcriptional regulator
VIQAYVLFKVNSGTERKTCEKLVDFDEVLVSSIIYGECDVIAKVSVPNMQELEEFLSERIRKVPSVILTSTMIVAREYKGRTRRISK